MKEIELFYRIVQSEIRRKHIKYLKKQKCKSAAETEPAKESQPGEEEYPSNEKKPYVKRFNKGIETALKVLESEFKAYENRLEKEAKDGKKF